MPALWPAGSIVVLMDGAPRQIELTPAERRLNRHFRIGPARRPVDDPSYVHRSGAFDGNGLRPYRPVHLRAEPRPGGDLALSWVRRTRLEGDSWEAPEVPLGEESERYLLRVQQGATVLRETMVTAPEWTYAAADRADDGLAGAYEIRVAQVSASYGPGPFASLGLSA
jgi:hypothetical protein